MAVFDTHQQKQSPSSSQKKDDDAEKKESGGQGSKSGSSSGGGNGKSGGGDDDPVKLAAQAIVAYADDPAMLGPNQYLRDLVEALKKALAAGEK